MHPLKDRTFVVTGATSDIGRSLVLSLSAAGADVALLDKNPERGRRLADEISDNREVKEQHGRAAYFDTDLANNASVKEAFSKTVETFGGIDVLVSAHQFSKISPILGAEYLSDLDRLIDINLKSTVFASHAVVPFMKGRKKGKIIYIVPDLIRWGIEDESLLALTRGGLTYYARSLSRELSAFNITVNCISVGPTEDYLLSRDPKAVSIKKAEEKLLQSLPLGRTLRASEIADTIVFLASSGADAVTGQTWSVNGGMI